MKARALLVAALCSICWVASSAAAEEQHHPFEIRPRVGVGFGPDQFVIGAGVILRERLFGLRVAPSLDAGFGDQQATVLANFDLLSPPISAGEKHDIYFGAGLAAAFYNPEEGSNHTEGNLNLILGTDLENFFIE